MFVGTLKIGKDKINKTLLTRALQAFTQPVQCNSTPNNKGNCKNTQQSPFSWVKVKCQRLPRNSRIITQ